MKKQSYRTLAVRKEWADLIACGAKRIENRTWGKPFAGQDVALYVSGPGGGHIIGVMHIREVIDGREALKKYPEQEEFIDEDLCWVIDRYTPLKRPVKDRGKLGTWPSPPLELADKPAWEGVE